MKKPSPNPPETDPISTCESDLNKLNETAEQSFNFPIPSVADIKATPRTPSTRPNELPLWTEQRSFSEIAAQPKRGKEGIVRHRTSKKRPFPDAIGHGEAAGRTTPHSGSACSEWR